MTTEEWRTAPEDPRYEVSSLGRVRSHVRGAPRFLRPGTLKDGYLGVTLGRNQYRVHRLVLSAFVGPCPTGMVARHLDGDPSNNVLSNLAWGTQAENWDDKRAHGTATVGERVNTSKLTAADVRAVRASALPNRDLADTYGVTLSTIRHIRARLTWRHIS